jgi:hypothetical protein
MKKILFISLLFVSVNLFSQKLPSDYSYNEDNLALLTNGFYNGKKSRKDYNTDYARRTVRRERIVGGTIFGTALVFFIKGCIDTYRINKM